MEYTALHRTVVQSPSHNQLINDKSILVSNGSNCLNLFDPIRILASTAASTFQSTLNMYPVTPDLHWHQYIPLCNLYWLLDSSNLYKYTTSSVCTCYPYTSTLLVYPLYPL